jgi:GntR family transcriptional regulator
MRVDPASFIPIYEQVKKEIRRLVVLGALKPHEALPSIRDLAGDLVVNPNTVARAYRELEQDGLVYTHKGRGTFVADKSAPHAEKARDSLLNQAFDEAIDEARRLNLGSPDILRLFEKRLRRGEGEDGK